MSLWLNVSIFEVALADDSIVEVALAEDSIVEVALAVCSRS